MSKPMPPIWKPIIPNKKPNLLIQGNEVGY
jgi:hypothetical protein